jgi:putative intracellular protease/amidase
MPRIIAILLFDGAEEMDFVGPWEVSPHHSTACRTILIGAEVVAAEVEVVVDPAVGGKKALRMTC